MCGLSYAHMGLIIQTQKVESLGDLARASCTTRWERGLGQRSIFEAMLTTIHFVLERQAAVWSILE